MNDPTKRFSNRVDNYVKYRPGYPKEVIDYLETQCHLTAKAAIADIGAGTGIFTKLLLERNYTVYAIEPNDDMRHEADRQLKHFPDYHSIAGRADLTGLTSHSIGLIVCAQAFHWFNTPETKTEFKRILKRGGKVTLIWNNRDIEADAFAIAYDLLLREQSGDYESINHQNLTEIDFIRFYKGGEYKLAKFHNQQVFDFEQLAGRAFSSSYVPAEETEAGKTFKGHLKDLFDTYQRHGKVVFKYNTEVYLGHV
ncbi:MAG TPA: class I SAM-dependent methyltransferase [Mucilaginibacter sp.]|jgi:ubiquinone/menaquinone biosynthesis C-methylase UbiE|nr:class I SAM-dependent methyltransferase [Mucilaginibacter sp.]